MNSIFKNIDEYTRSYPKDVQGHLEQIRTTIKLIAPDAVESISYGMPAYKLHGSPLVYFAAFKNHVGSYATPTGHSEFAKELSNYKQGKGSVQFPLDKAMPLDLISKIVKFRVNENLKKVNIKMKKSF
jgi:uncharacterized protein YdhG (YjbR/CyaY superfamily)